MDAEQKFYFDIQRESVVCFMALWHCGERRNAWYHIHHEKPIFKNQVQFAKITSHFQINQFMVMAIAPTQR